MNAFYINQAIDRADGNDTNYCQDLHAQYPPPNACRQRRQRSTKAPVGIGDASAYGNEER